MFACYILVKLFQPIMYGITVLLQCTFAVVSRNYASFSLSTCGIMAVLNLIPKCWASDSDCCEGAVSVTCLDLACLSTSS
jgi:hypothetical protein